ncbi:MotA/TolQ/ExbB proton channel family protein [Chitiniphilus eburneus]|uniref:Biopolymer transport protein ExbB n=1 Tax=Chitiniphilus eburneus TaxID=2571148 RepID=A0A4U0Q848_9NEIS|nr:MotA/TolQ/ExbB proton channel family protein [Chitiniphilus eburneus]TJZ77355.1 MotA/TolQ/ExbB proton channel family protein [Chitiniphilus eburneus]
MENNPYGIAALWAQGDAVTRGVAILLLLMSVASWCVIVMKTWRLVHLRRQARSATHDFWHQRDFAAGLAVLGETKAENPFRNLAEEGAEAVAHHAHNKSDLHGALNVSDWVTSNLRRGIDDAAQAMQSGLSILASVGSTAPFVGLFGTVWGIYHALVSIGVTGQASIDKVAGPVGEALIMTAFGLAVAIPAVLGYNALARGNKSVLAQLNRFAHDLHAYFITGARVGTASPAPTLNVVGGR